MSKTTGIGARLFFHGFDVSGDVASLGSIAQTRELDNMTSIKSEAMEREDLLLDGAMELACFYNPESTAGSEGIHEIIKNLGGEKHVMYLHRAQLGTPSATVVSRAASYGLERSDTGAMRGSISAQASDGKGLFWGRSLTAGGHESIAAEDLAGVDNGAASSGGWSAYLQIVGFTGTNITVTLEHSDDDGVVDPYAPVTNGAFTQVTSANSVERIEDAGTLKQWVRVALSGIYTSATVVVVLVRH